MSKSLIKSISTDYATSKGVNLGLKLKKYTEVTLITKKWNDPANPLSDLLVARVRQEERGRFVRLLRL